MRNLCSFLVIVLCISVGSLLPRPGWPAATPVEALAQGATAFTLNLYRQLRVQEKDNLFFSPYSVSLALSMAYAGARGETATEMARVLGFAGSPAENLALLGELNRRLVKAGNEAGQTLTVANAAWLNSKFRLRPDYLKLIKDQLASEIQQLDFCQGAMAEKTINGWVARKTRDRIRDLIPSGVLNCDTRLVLTNAIYFLGSWAEKFAPDQTRPEAFWVTPEQKVEVPLMHRQGEYSYTEAGGWQALEMSYREYQLSMVVLLPKTRGGLGELEAKLEAGALEKLLQELHPRQVEVSLPRFEIKTRTELSSSLKGAGMAALFTPQADFSGITTEERLFISLVLHQAWVKVEEKGTEAAAATAVGIKATAAPMKKEPVVFRADHPFLFLIRDRQTGLILFWGRLANPKVG